MDRIFVECSVCNGSGVEAFLVRVFEHGCGFAHDDTDERPCRQCDGNGLEEVDAEPITLEDLP